MWYKNAASLVWGMMGSGIMFRHKGNVFLQLRSSSVAQGGTWGVPGGALDGTDGWYYTEPLDEEGKFDVLDEHEEIVRGFGRNGTDLYENPDEIETLEEPPVLDDRMMRRLWFSALKEVKEELGFLPDLSEDQYVRSQKIVNWIGNFPYVTFVVDVTDEQAEEIMSSSTNTWESDAHKWYHAEELPERTHHGVDYVMKHMSPEDGDKVDVEGVTLASALPDGIIAVAVDRWTQNQVYDDGVHVYDIDVLNKILEGNRVEDVKVSSLVNQLYDKEVWGENDRGLSPMMVLTNPTFDHTTIRHMTRIRMSNPSKPIIIRFRTGKVIDGYHRLSKSFMRGDRTIKALFAQEEQMSKSIFKD